MAFDRQARNNRRAVEVVFSAQFVPRLYKEEHMSLRESAEAAVRRVGYVRWPPACEDVSPGAEDRPFLEDVTKQSSEGRD
jgi:hypothetical protein